jgi:phthalate 4,5-cis-dihydrodiol dehydrogenase
MTTLRLGVAGLGRAASSMLPSLAAHPNVRITAAADPNPAARERFVAEFGGATYENAATLCAEGPIDAVYIATPHQCHVDDVVAAARYRKHAIVEKPMALSLEECATMNAAADAAGIVLVVGHTHAFDPVIQRMREIVVSGELGRVRAMTNLVYTDFLYRPRRPEELDSSRGGGIMYNQVPHQLEIARELAGAPLHTVKAVTGIWDPQRRTEGAMSAFLEFADGTVASLVYSGYDRFDSDEFAFGIGESGGEKRDHVHGAARRALRRAASPEEEARMKAASGFAGSGLRRTSGTSGHQPHFGMLLVSCERGDMRPAADGILVYDDEGKREIALPPGRTFPNKDGVIDEFYDAVVHGRPARHDGRWGAATVDAMLALIRSARERREIALSVEVAHGTR